MRLMGVTYRWLFSVTYAVLPSGAIAIESGFPPTRIGVPADLVARSTGMTVPFKRSGTQAVDPSGAIARAMMPLAATMIGVPSVFVAVSIGVILFCAAT